MVSFDVESLFTNIPLNECIDLAVKYVSEGNPDLKLSSNELKTLFHFATSRTHFLFRGSFYHQIDGVAMGSAFAPVLAKLFMGHHEYIWLKTYRASKILFSRRYVDDAFCVFEKEQDALLFFDFINTRHRNIRFTMEKEVDHKLPFLDVFIHSIHQVLLQQSFAKRHSLVFLLITLVSLLYRTELALLEPLSIEPLKSTTRGRAFTMTLSTSLSFYVKTFSLHI